MPTPLSSLLPLAAPPTLSAALPPLQAARALCGWHVTALPTEQTGLIWQLSRPKARPEAPQIAQLQRVAVIDPQVTYSPLTDYVAAPLLQAGKQAQQVGASAYALLGPADTATAPRAVAQQVWQGLSAQQQQLLKQLRQLLPASGSLAVVGGAVRDILLGLEAAPRAANLDLDVVVIGQAVEPLARQLAQEYRAPYSFHAAYGNATVHLPQTTLDLIAARMEHYPVAGQAPQTWPATLSQDLARRDFTLNTLALVLAADGGLHLHDPFGGLKDLKAQVLRPLHPASLREDASRLLRAARLAARLSLSAHATLLSQIPAALQVAPQTPRLWAEVRLALSEPRPSQVFQLLNDWQAPLFPAQVAALLRPLDCLPTRPSDTVYAATLLLAVDNPAHWANILKLGNRSLSLLARAHSDRPYPPDSPETLLRSLLGSPPLLNRYPSLTGRDLLALGFSAGPQLGQVLRELARRKKQGDFATAEDERAAAQSWLKSLASDD